MSGPGTGPVSVLKMPMQPSFTPAPYKAPDPTATPTGVMSGPGSGSAKPVSVMSGSASSSGPSVQVQAKPQPAPPPPKPVKSDAQIKAETLARAVSNIIAALNPPIKTHIDGLAALHLLGKPKDQWPSGTVEQVLPLKPPVAIFMRPNVLLSELCIPEVKAVIATLDPSKPCPDDKVKAVMNAAIAKLTATEKKCYDAVLDGLKIDLPLKDGALWLCLTFCEPNCQADIRTSALVQSHAMSQARKIAAFPVLAQLF